jgi:Class III cytochrome C family
VKRRWLLILIAANLLALVTLAFVYPHLMISPGALVNGHAELETDCFSCHSPWRGVTTERCIVCHALPDIGLRTTKGAPLAQRTIKTSFHQELIEQNCMACHSDHAGPKLTQRSRKPFSHSVLRATVRERCESCHDAPRDTLHRDLTVRCSQCHSQERWQPATFDHALLTKAQQDHCNVCHKAPDDSLHRQIKGNCNQCHGQEHWKPATFDHDKLFLLDRDHNASCATCHTNDDFSRYTCYGCHEHTPGNVRAEHLEEGIRDFENCVECHRNASDEPERGESREDRERD